jgi:hypothetical protein
MGASAGWSEEPTPQQLAIWGWLRFCFIITRCRVVTPPKASFLEQHSHPMTPNSTIEEIRTELAKLQLAYEVLEKSHRRLVAKVLADRSEADHFVGQMVIDRTLLTPGWLKGR